MMSSMTAMTEYRQNHRRKITAEKSTGRLKMMPRSGQVEPQAKTHDMLT
jgi:hypothetical protein